MNDCFEIKYEEPTGSVGHHILHAYDLDIAVGGFASATLEGLNIRIVGGKSLSTIFGDANRLAEKYNAKPNDLPGDYTAEGEREPIVPAEDVEKLRQKALEIALDHFKCHPERFLEYIEFRDSRMRALGACLQAKAFRKALMIDGHGFGGVALSEPRAITQPVEGGWKYEN